MIWHASTSRRRLRPWPVQGCHLLRRIGSQQWLQCIEGAVEGLPQVLAARCIADQRLQALSTINCGAKLAQACATFRQLQQLVKANRVAAFLLCLDDGREALT